MNMSNVLLIVMAIILLWAAINLDRSSQTRIVDDQNSQLNDSIEFLRKLKNKSAQEESHGRRIEAYRETVQNAVGENPLKLEQIEDDFGSGTQANNSGIKELLNATNKIKSDLEIIQSKSSEMKNKGELDSRASIENLTNLYVSIQDIESTTSEFTNKSALLARDIAEVKEYLA